MQNRLTDISLRNLPTPIGRAVYHWDTGLKGFGVRVSPKGAKTFVAMIASGARHTIGRYPRISLSDAREEAKRQLAKKTLGTYEKPTTVTFDAAVGEYLAACEKKNRPRTVSEYKRHLALLSFKGRRLHTIKKRDVTAQLDKIDARGERSHVLVSAKVFFSWCAGQGYIDASPLTALKTSTGATRRGKHVLSTEELKTVLTEALKGSDTFSRIVALLVLTGQRRNEIASLEWERISDQTLTIPGEIAKNRVEHKFPYGSLVRRVLDTIPAQQSPYVFPASRDHVRGKLTSYFNGWGKAKAAFDKRLKDVEPYKLHDLRRTFATTLQALAIPLEVREKLLNHISGTQAGVAGVYNRYGYENEMKEAIEEYDKFLIRLLAEE